MIALQTTTRAPRLGLAGPAPRVPASLPSGWWLLPAVVLSLTIWVTAALLLIPAL